MRRTIECLVAAGVGALVTYTALNKPRRRRKRHERFLSNVSGTSVGISVNLLQATRLLLLSALEERRHEVWRTAGNHAAWYAPTVIITVATALDAWLSELIGLARSWVGLSKEQVASVIDIAGLDEKYERTAGLLFQKRIRPSTDLRYLSKVRNEIVHFLPYAQDISAGTVPDWLQYLEQKDLLISANGAVDFHFSQKLGSYALAYWACETAFKAAQALAEKAQDHPLQHLVSAGNFGIIAGVHAPNELQEFDARYGLTLTQ